MKIENYDARYFKLNGLPYRKKDYAASFQNIELNNVTDEDIKLNTLVNIVNKFTGVSILGGSIKVRDFQNASNVNYSSFSTFITDLQTILDDNTLASVGPTGPTGPQGPAGPAGLYWKGAWVSGTSYVVNDAVGYGGASYFCILATSGTSNPTVATTNWALLASQGAVGPTGPTGATGATGAQGIQGTPGEGLTKVVKTTITSAQVLQLFTTPITVLNSNNPLTIAYPINVYIKRKTGTAYTLAANSFSIINDFGTVMTGNLNPNPLANTEGYFQSAITLSQNLSGSGVVKNSLYKLKANTGDPTLGTGDLDVYVTYVEITI